MGFNTAYIIFGIAKWKARLVFRTIFTNSLKINCTFEMIKRGH